MGSYLTLNRSEAGMHVIGWLRHGLKDQEVLEAAAQHKVEIIPLSSHYLGKCEQDALIMGFTGIIIENMIKRVKRLNTAINSIE